METKFSPFKSQYTPKKSTIPAIELELDQGLPFQLLSINYLNGEFFINPKLSQIFDEIDGNIAFISVIGPKKSGKSFILNRILGLKDSDGFKIGGFSQGIWLWSSPIYIEKENVYVFFLEFEGFGENEKTSIIEEKLMMIAMSFSSTVLILNNKNYEENLQRIYAMLGFFHENIRISDDKSDIEEIQPPNFLCILKEKENYSGRLKNSYMRSEITIEENANSLIKALKNEANMILIDERSPESINAIREKILRKPQRKEIAGILLTKNLFLLLIDLMIETLNANKIVEIGKMIRIFVEKEVILAFDDAICIYKDLKIEENLDEETFNELLRVTYENALTMYISKTFKIRERFRDIEQKFLFKLKDYANEFEIKAKNHYNEKAQALAMIEFKKTSVNLMHEINLGIYSLQEFNQFIKALDSTFQEFDQNLNYNDIKFKAIMKFLPELLVKTFETFKKKDIISKDSKEPVFSKESQIFRSEQKTMFQNTNKSKFLQSNISKTQNLNLENYKKLNDDLFIENERLRTSLIEKDRLLKQKEEIIKSFESSALKKGPNHSNSKKSSGCLKNVF